MALELAYDFLVSAGESDARFRLNLLWLVALVPTLVVAAHVGGITGVAAGHVIALAVVVLPAYLRRSTASGVTSASIVGPITRPLAGGALMALTALAALGRGPDGLRPPGRRRARSALVSTALVVGLPLWRQHRRGELFRSSAPAPVVEVAA